MSFQTRSIGFRAVRRQKVQAEPGSLVIGPLQMKFGAMVLCVVADCHDAAARNGADFAEHFQELPEGLSIESSGFAPKEKLAVPQTHGGKIADALACWMMLHNWIFEFRRNPHAAARSLLLKVHFVQCP